MVQVKNLGIKNYLSSSDLSKEQILYIFDLAQAFKSGNSKYSLKSDLIPFFFSVLRNAVTVGVSTLFKTAN